MTHPGSSDVAQRRFWNALNFKPGIIAIRSWDGLDDRSVLWAGFDNPDYDATGVTYSEKILWHYVYSGKELKDAKIYPWWAGDRAEWIELAEGLPPGTLPFPPEFKLARYWRWQFTNSVSGLVGVDYDGTNEWIFKPFSTEFDLVGPNHWMRGKDWNTANLFYESGPFAIPTSLHYEADLRWKIFPPRSKLAFPWVYSINYLAQGFGPGGLLYGYLNDRYFGNNEYGGDKPSVGEGPLWSAVGDLSKSYGGLHGSFGISHGIFLWGAGLCEATWTFDLCDRPQQQLVANFNNEISHQIETGENQSEGWGTDIVSVHENTLEFEDGRQETYLHFSTNVSPARGSFNVYSMQGLMLAYGVDYIKDECDKSGRSYRLLKEPPDPCMRYHTLIVTYLVVADTLQTPTHLGRSTETNVAHDRQSPSDIRGL